MLYPTLNQPLVFLIMFCTGIICGIIFSLTKMINNKISRYKILVQLFYFLSIVFSFALFSFLNLICNFGQLRLYVFLATGIGIFVEKTILQKIWTKLNKKCYNLLHGRKENKEKQI